VAHILPNSQISWVSTDNFWSYFAKKQTDSQTLLAQSHDCLCQLQLGAYSVHSEYTFCPSVTSSPVERVFSHSGLFEINLWWKNQPLMWHCTVMCLDAYVLANISVLGKSVLISTTTFTAINASKRFYSGCNKIHHSRKIPDEWFIYVGVGVSSADIVRSRCEPSEWYRSATRIDVPTWWRGVAAP